ncbi:hypothetical protein JHK82_057139 [Glycine max]|nr:hypothetical protein JHK82_057139 [Glycine max]
MKLDSSNGQAPLAADVSPPHDDGAKEIFVPPLNFVMLPVEIMRPIVGGSLRFQDLLSFSATSHLKAFEYHLTHGYHEGEKIKILAKGFMITLYQLDVPVEQRNGETVKESKREGGKVCFKGNINGKVYGGRYTLKKCNKREIVSVG